MNLMSELAELKNQSPNLPFGERAELSCRMAKRLEKAGEYEAASEALSEFWPNHNELPNLEGLDGKRGAQVLLRVGALAAWMGSTRLANGSQETAKDLITRSIEIFEALGETLAVAEARSDLALCYWREGAFDEARIQLNGALERVNNHDNELRACLLIRAGMVEVDARRLDEALRFYNRAAPLLEQSSDDAIKGAFHNQLALWYKNLYAIEPRVDYADRALIEYTAAGFHFEQAGHTRHYARVENNVGFLFSTIGKYAEAHTHLDRARNLFLSLGDRCHIAQVDDTCAQTLLAEGRTLEAERVARSTVRTLEKGDEHALLAEALTTHSTALARLGHYSRSNALLNRAIEVAETAGDLEGAGRAKLSIIEELSEQTSSTDLASIYQSAADLLEHSQDPSTNKRMMTCARKVIDVLGSAQSLDDPEGKGHSWEGFSFKKEVLKSERTLLERALRDAGGSVTRAARLLGFKHHQSLISLINSRHKELLKTRSAVRQRRQHLFSRPRKMKRKIVKHGPERTTSQITILHVEQDPQIARIAHEMFVDQEWAVDLCADGFSALEKLTSNNLYDALVVDNDLPGLSGLELVKRARKMTHRRRTPIIMISVADCETEAWGAGVNAFLRKPDQLSDLTSTLGRLL